MTGLLPGQLGAVQESTTWVGACGSRTAVNQRGAVGAVPPAARRYRTRVTILAPAAAVADRIGPWVGTLEPIDAATCTLDTGADQLDILAVQLGLLNVDFIVTEPPELVSHLRTLAARYARAVPN